MTALSIPSPLELLGDWGGWGLEQSEAAEVKLSLGKAQVREGRGLMWREGVVLTCRCLSLSKPVLIGSKLVFSKLCWFC